MITNIPNKALQGQRPTCTLCNGTGKVDVVNRDKVCRGTAEAEDKAKMPCPCCRPSGFYRTK